MAESSMSPSIFLQIHNHIWQWRSWGMNRLPCCLVIDREMLAEICNHLHIYNCLSDVACMLALLLCPLFSSRSELLIQIQMMKFLIPACKVDAHFGRYLGKMDRFSWSFCFIQTRKRRGESNYRDLSLKAEWVALTRFLFRESCRDAIFLLIPIGISLEIEFPY